MLLASLVLLLFRRGGAQQLGWTALHALYSCREVVASSSSSSSSEQQHHECPSTTTTTTTSERGGGGEEAELKVTNLTFSECERLCALTTSCDALVWEKGKRCVTRRCGDDRRRSLEIIAAEAESESRRASTLASAVERFGKSRGAVECVLRPQQQAAAEEGDLVKAKGLISESRVVAQFSRASSYRFFTVVDLQQENGTTILLARDGDFPNGTPNEALVAWRTTPELDGVSSQHRPQLVKLPSGATTVRSSAAAVDHSTAGGFGSGVAVELSDVAHNFGVLVENDDSEKSGALSFFGGRGRSRTSPGVAVLRAPSMAAALRGEWNLSEASLVASDHHPGCLEGVFPRCAFDGKISTASLRRDLGEEVFLYARLNPRAHRRYVQVASAMKKKKNGQSYDTFGPFEPMSIKGWTGCDVASASVYYAAVVRNPVDPTSLLGFFPVHKRTQGGGLGISSKGQHPTTACFVGLALSCDGVRFSSMVKLVNAGCAHAGRVQDFPVDGLVERGTDVFFYVHRSMPSLDALRSGAFNPAIVRHTIPKADLLKFTNKARRDVLCHDNPGTLRRANHLPTDLEPANFSSPAHAAALDRLTACDDVDPAD